MNCGFTSNAFGAGSNFLEGIRRMCIRSNLLCSVLLFEHDDRKSSSQSAISQNPPPSSKSTLSHAMIAYTRSTSRSKRGGVRHGRFGRETEDRLMGTSTKTRYETFYLPKKLNRHKTPSYAPKSHLSLLSAAEYCRHGCKYQQVEPLEIRAGSACVVGGRMRSRNTKCGF